MRYRATCPTCRRRTTITLETLTPASHPVCATCGTPLRLTTETMCDTPLAEVWIVPPEQGAEGHGPPAIERISTGLAPQQQAAFEALLRQACRDEAGLAGYIDL